MFYFSEGTKCNKKLLVMSELDPNCIGRVCKFGFGQIRYAWLYFVGCVRNGFLCFPKQLKKLAQNVETRNILGYVRMSNLMYKCSENTGNQNIFENLLCKNEFSFFSSAKHKAVRNRSLFCQVSIVSKFVHTNFKTANLLEFVRDLKLF